MQAMILDDDPQYQALVARALMARGFMVICVDSLAAAEAVVRLDMLDLVILGERVQGRLSHNVALLADCRVPAVPSVLVTDRTGDEIAELFELIPAIYSILGRRTAPSMVAQIAVAAVTAGPARKDLAAEAERKAAAVHETPAVADHPVAPPVAAPVAAAAAPAASLWAPPAPAARAPLPDFSARFAAPALPQSPPEPHHGVLSSALIGDDATPTAWRSPAPIARRITLS
jgi:hypothetical protein